MVNHVHDALKQVNLIKTQLRDSRQFNGYSGIARIAGALIALCGAFFLSSPSFPHWPAWHIAGWGAIAAAAFSINYGSLLYFRMRHQVDLKHQAVTDPLIIIGFAGLVTLAILRAHAYALLCGVWMVFFGLMHLGARKSLPHANGRLGWYYLTAGAAYLIFVPDADAFLNPWPMALVFFAGETAGGIIFLMTGKKREASL